MERIRPFFLFFFEAQGDLLQVDGAVWWFLNCHSLLFFVVSNGKVVEEHVILEIFVLEYTYIYLEEGCLEYKKEF